MPRTSGLMSAFVAHDPDPKAGDQQTDLSGIVYGEPDPSIFVPPSEYSIQVANQ
jgi:hypothetical protein